MTTITTNDARYSSPRLGHDTLFISASTEIKKSAKLGMLTMRKAIQVPRASTANGSTYWDARSTNTLSRAPAGTTKLKSHELKLASASLARHAVAANTATIAANVACRAILP